MNFARIAALPSCCLALAAALGPSRTSTPSAPRAGEIKSAGEMKDARADHTATLLKDGRVLIAGGMVQNGEFLATAELYDPPAGRFTPTGSMSARRVGAAALLIPGGKVLITGGLSGRRMVDGRWRGELQSSAELYDPDSGRFEPAGQMLQELSNHRMVTLRDGRILIIGGSSSAGGPTASCEIYDRVRGTFTPAASMHEARISSPAVLLKNGHVLVAGGSGADGTVLAGAEEYDPKADRWTQVGSLAAPRHKHSAVLLPDGRVLVVGGSDNRDWQGQYDTAEIYDPATHRFTATPPMGSKRFKLPDAVVLLKNGNVLVAGGAATADVFQPQTGSFVQAAGDLDGPHYFASATLLASGKVLIVGGYGTGRGHPNGPVSTNRAWLYEP